MPAYNVINSLNAGELSRRLWSRPDLDVYSRGCSEMVNFFPTPYGGAERRPGTKFQSRSLKDSTEISPPRIIQFVFNDKNAYIVEIYSFGMMAFNIPGEYAYSILDDIDGLKESVPVYQNTYEDENGNIVNDGEIAYYIFPPEHRDIDPYLIQFTQVGDVLYLVSPQFSPKRVERRLDENGNVIFVREDIAFKSPPTLDPCSDGTRLTCRIPSTGDKIIEASQDAFDADDVGRELIITSRREVSEVMDLPRRDAGGSTTMAWTRVKGAWTFVTHGTWTGTIRIWRHYGDTAPTGTPADEDIFARHDSENDFNISQAGDEQNDGAWFRIDWECTKNVTKCTGTFSNPGYSEDGRLRILSVTDARNATVKIVSGRVWTNKPFSGWRWCAFSAKTGYPSAVSIYQERLMFAGTSAHPGRIWGSRTNAWDDFRTAGGEDDSALDLTLTGSPVGRICWLQDKNALIAGTTEDEWSVSAAQSGGALTASSIRIRRNSAFGSKLGVPCILAEDRLLFVQRDGKRIRSFQYSWEQDSYASEDITLLADHICQAGIKDIALQRSPYTILWTVMNDGTLATATLNAEQKVTAWQRIEIGANIRSCCVLPGADGDDEKVYLSQYLRFEYTNRKGRKQLSSSHDILEFFPRKEKVYKDPPPYEQRTYLDFAERILPVDDSTHRITCKRKFIHHPAFTVVSDDGRIYRSGDFEFYDRNETDLILPDPITGGWCGLSYESRLSPMPAELQLPRGLSLLRGKSSYRLLVDYYESRGGEVRAGEGPWTPIAPRDAQDDPAKLPPLKDGVCEGACLAGHPKRLTAQIRTSAPWPLNISAVCQTVSAEGI